MEQDPQLIREQELMKEQGNLMRAEQERKRIEEQEQRLRDLERSELSEEELNRYLSLNS